MNTGGTGGIRAKNYCSVSVRNLALLISPRVMLGCLLQASLAQVVEKAPPERQVQKRGILVD
jgi:hypothetical protein